MLIRRTSLGASFIVLALVVSLGARAIAAETYHPIRTTTPPVIDGKLDDSIWTVAPRLTNFKTFIPDYGKLIDEQTVAMAAYDDENLYFGFRCYEPDPSKIKTSISSRDNITSDDWVCVNLDPFNDHQGLFCFYTNPNGIQADSHFANNNEDFSIDLVWYSAGHIDSLGYTLEVQIPLKSIRYADGDPVTMGVVFERYISRRSEHSSYPELDPAKGGAFATQMMPMAYTGVKHYPLVELLPAITYGQHYSAQNGSIRQDSSAGKFSFTGKYGVTSNLILDGTYNPDFSQVESDAGQVDINLRYSLFYPEKRPFFLEGRDNFNIAAMAITPVSQLDPIQSVLNTRNIVDPLVGVKLSGKVGDNGTLASLYTL
ncbi:MAG TPA: DUF5916 domain-containing protein, partial [Bacteroidota bacterium]|nr:DUF5916 domain-containing protein [Bacteroidota bacterium]